MPAAPGLCQTRPRTPQQQAPTPGGQEAMQATPYRQQVFPPELPAPKLSTTPSAGQDHGDPAGEAEGARGLGAGNEGADPPPEDPGSTDGVPPATV